MNSKCYRLIAIGISTLVLLIACSREPEQLSWTAIQQADGSWCANKLLTACVRPDGTVQIPSGDALETIRAYMAIQGKHGSENPVGGWFVGGRSNKILGRGEFQTREVSGRLTTPHTLDRMLEGSGLTWNMSTVAVLLKDFGAEGNLRPDSPVILIYPAVAP